jgi:hypothetical protein
MISPFFIHGDIRAGYGGRLNGLFEEGEEEGKEQSPRKGRMLGWDG